MTRVTLRSLLKKGLLAFIYYTGLLWIILWIRLRHRAVVLMYHRVIPAQRIGQSFSAPSIVVTPETFERHIRLVKRFLRPVSAKEFTRLQKSGQPLPDRTCLVTFDDGWHDNLEFALPILQRHKVPAVLFIATDYIGTEHSFWQERVARLLFSLRGSRAAASVFDELGLPTIRDLTPNKARYAIRGLVDQLKLRPLDEIEVLYLRLLKMLPSPLELGEDRFLSWDDVRAIAELGLVEIGSHAASHRPLTQIPLMTVKEEFERSAMTIRTCVGKDAFALAYPNGDANAAIGAFAKQAGYSIAFTTVRGLVAAGCDPYLLPRINIHESATYAPAGFLGRITGLF